MTLKLLTILLVLLALTENRDCAPFHVFYMDKCLLTCDHPFFNNCPDSILPTPGLTVCVYLLDGTTVEADFGCGPCSNPAIVGMSYGSCPPPPPPPEPECEDWQIVVDGECVDKCVEMECPEGKFCRKGKCHKKCLPWQVDVDGHCKDKCVEMTCPEGQACHHGRCKRNWECGFGLPCEDGKVCVEGKCV